MLVNREYYFNEYTGKDIKSDNFDQLSKEAERIISTKTNFDEWEKLTQKNQTRVKNAICVLIEYENDIATTGEIQGGFSIGSFRVDAGAVIKPDESKAWAKTEDYLFPTGLLYKGVAVW